MRTNIFKSQQIKFQFVVLLFCIVALLAISRSTAKAACPTVDTSRGVVTATINIPSSGDYRVWSRMQASGSSNDSFILEVDDTNCGIVVGDSAVPTGSWKWVNYKNGNANSAISLNLSAGNHTVKMIGREDGVMLDRIMFLSDTSCVPSDSTKGDNCVVVADTQPPQVSLTAPRSGDKLAGKYVLTANATDNVGVTRVDFLVNGNVVGSSSKSPWYYELNTVSLTDGSYTILAKAYDAAGNSASSPAATVTVGNTSTPPPEFRPVCDFIGIKGKIDAQDLGHVIYYFNKGQPVDKGTKGDCYPINDPTGNPNPDMDKRGDGKVNLQDINMLINRWTAQRNASGQ